MPASSVFGSLVMVDSLADRYAGGVAATVTHLRRRTRLPGYAVCDGEDAAN